MSVSTNLKPSKPAIVKTAAARPHFLDGLFDGIGIDPNHAPPLLAVSGGADSMALAASFITWWQDRGWGDHPCHAAVVDHRLRPLSTREAETVAVRLTGLGLTPRVLTVQKPRPEGGIQAWARQQRYDLLADHAFNLSPNAIIMTAHHRGDQAETMAMRLLHASGLRGLAGISRDTVYGGMRIIRPLLDISPDALRASLDKAGIAAVDDPSNKDHRFERVRIREMLTHRNVISKDDLIRLSEAARRINAHLHEALGVRIKNRCGVMPLGYGWIDFGLLHDLPQQGGLLLLDGMIRALGARHRPAREKAVKNLLSILRDGGSTTLGGCEWRLDQKARRIIICREAELDLEPLRLGADESGLFDGRWRVTAAQDGVFEAMGEKRFAEGRRSFPHLFDDQGPAARVYWSMPVFRPDRVITAKKNADNQLPALEDGSIITHINFRFDKRMGHPMMCFACMAHWPWHKTQQARAQQERQ